MSYDASDHAGTPDFRLMQGGPIYRLMVRLHLQGIEQAFVLRRSLLLIALTWCPLFVMSLLQGQALPGTAKLPFLYDFPSHVLFLVTLPLLIIAEVVIEPAVAKSLGTFLSRGLVRERDRPAFISALDWAKSRCNSGWSELVIVLLALFPLVFLRGSHWADNLSDSWAMLPDNSRLSPAGIWTTCFGAFVARALLYRWVWRLIIWTRLLSRLARLDLHTVGTHPDRAGGLGFMAEVEMRFGILSFAVGLVVSSNVASNIVFHHATLSSEKSVVIVFIAGATILLLLPLLALSGVLMRTWRKGMADYGRLATEYAQEFDQKWIERAGEPNETLLGTGDIQSLADMANSYQVVQEMKFLPINRRCLIALALSAALPMAPLVFLDPWALEIAQKVLSRIL